MHIHYSKNELDAFGQFVTDDYEMEIVGKEIVYGWSNVKDHLSRLIDKPKKLVITQILSHGKYGAAHGKFVYDDHEVAFSNYYEFLSVASSKVKKTVSYLVSLYR